MPPGLQGLEIPAMGNFFAHRKPLSDLVAVAIKDGTEGKEPCRHSSGARCSGPEVPLDTPGIALPRLPMLNAWSGRSTFAKAEVCQ